MEKKVSGKLAQHFRMCVKMWWNFHSKKNSLNFYEYFFKKQRNVR